MELIFVRHGETDCNKKGTYYGWTDVELNEAGIKQAHCVRQKLEGVKIDAIFSSPLKRAYETAQIIAQNLGLEIICSHDLKERNFGMWENLTYKDISEKYPLECQQWNEDWINYCIKCGETAMEVYLRCVKFIDELINSRLEGTYVVVTHLGCIRNMLSHLMGMSIEGSWHFRVDNGSITRLHLKDKYPVLTLLNS